MSPKISHPTLFTAAAYLLLALFIWQLNKYSRSGPCTPGLGIMAFIFLPFLSLIAFVITLVLFKSGHPKQKFSMIIHGSVCRACIMLFLWARFFH
jgi:hypothetical protein